MGNAARFTIGSRVRVSLDSDRWRGAEGRIAAPSAEVARGREVQFGLDPEAARSAHRELNGTTYWWVEFDDPELDFRETDRGYARTTAGEVPQQFLLEPGA